MEFEATRKSTASEDHKTLLKISILQFYVAMAFGLLFGVLLFTSLGEFDRDVMTLKNIYIMMAHLALIIGILRFLDSSRELKRIAARFKEHAKEN